MDAERGNMDLDDLYSGKLTEKKAWMQYWNQGDDRVLMEEKWDKAQAEVGAPVDEESWYPGKRIKEKIDEIPAHAEVYLKKVLFGDRDPITEEVFSEEEYGRVTEGLKQNILSSLEKPRETGWGESESLSDTFFDTQGRLRNRVSQGAYSGDISFDEEYIIGSFEPHFNFYSEGLPYELKTILGSARFNLKKGEYNTEKLTIDSDQYDFAEDYAGLRTEPGFNIDNLRQYYDLVKHGEWRRAAERFGNRRLPDQDTVDRWKRDYGIDREAEYAPVNISIPVSDIFSEYEWAILQRRKEEETPVHVASLSVSPKEPPTSLSLAEWQAKHLPTGKLLDDMLEEDKIL